MAERSVEEFRDQILARVRQAGAEGLPKSKIGTFKAGSNGAAALAALVKEGSIRNLGSPARARFVVAEFFRPLELAYKAVLERIEKEPLNPWSRAKLEVGLAGAVKAKAGEAIDLLAEERRLLPVRFGAGRQYLSVRQIREGLGEGSPAESERQEATMTEEAQPAPGAETPSQAESPTPSEKAMDDLIDRVWAAYRQVKARIGFSDVKIYAVREAAGLSQAEIDRTLRELSARGQAVLSLGDYSLSSEAEHSAAIEMLGRPHLLVRLKEGGAA
jgi:hypothetical protein